MITETAGSPPHSPEILSGEEKRRKAVTHPDGPLLVIGAAGTGKTSLLVERFIWLVEQGNAPEGILLLASSSRAADELREQLEDALTASYAELTVTTCQGFCAKLLHDEALEAGIDPFSSPLASADRLAMLLERIDELPLARHDLRGNPSALLGSIVERIDRLKDELVSQADYAAWAATLSEANDAERTRAAREREFAEIYGAHERMLSEVGALDYGDLVLHAFSLLRLKPHVRARVAARYPYLLVDDFQDASFAQGLLLRLLAAEHGNITAVGDEDQAIHRFRGAANKNLLDFQSEWPNAKTIVLEESLRLKEDILVAAAAVVAHNPDRIPKNFEPKAGDESGDVEFWRCANERAQAQAVASDIERLLVRGEVVPEDVCVLVRSMRTESQAIGLALEERSVPYRLSGAAAFFQRAEVRDVLAWLRLLVDPADSGAVVRALARPPIELRAIDIARCTQIARRRKLDMVSALAAALEAPQIPPEARDRLNAFLKIYRGAIGYIDSMRPDLFVHRLIERLGLRRQLLFAASTEVVERLRNLSKFGELASTYVRRAPQATAREFARSIAAVAEAGLREEAAAGSERSRAVLVTSLQGVQGLEFRHVYILGTSAARLPGPRLQLHQPIPDALLKENLPPDDDATHEAVMRRLLYVSMTRARDRLVLAYPERISQGAVAQPSPLVEDARLAIQGNWESRDEELFGPAETLQSTFRILRDELLTTVSQVGGRLGELRFDTDLDVPHATVRYLEVLKLAALMERTRNGGQTVEEALPEINARLLSSATSEQREIFESSAVDEYLLDAEQDDKLRSKAVAAKTEPSLEGFLPRRGDGLLLSASDIESYLSCPLKYKFARVFRIPKEPTLNQRFGIVVHQVLERFHSGQGGSGSLTELLALLEGAWRKGGLGNSEEERQLRKKATQALIRYHERFQTEKAEPVWFERSFQFRIDGNLLRGRVDRVDKLPDGTYELIDYKTGRPKTAAQLENDIQLALYAVAARDSWELESTKQSYYYLLDDQKIPVDKGEKDREWVTDTVKEVSAGILSQSFEPTPSFTACSWCDYRIACPAAEQ